METDVALQRLQELTAQMNPKELTQEAIDIYAKEISDNIDSPLAASVGIKSLEILLAKIRANLSDEVRDLINDMAESQKRIGNITFNTASKTTIEYKEDPQYVKLLEPAEARKKELKKAYEEAEAKGIKFQLKVTKSPYYTVNIPKT